jgi:lipopolysaccharide transport system ATP-binding protein
MATSISVRNLCKRYNLGEMRVYDTLRDSIAGLASSIIRRDRCDGAGHTSKPLIHTALDDVSFDVEAGEVLGIIGRNGSGKSTLLKILARVTSPSEGEVNYFGRIAPLLEVGTGFNHELTGRENIFVNGTLLGMRRREIEENFDAIVDFAGVEKYIDTPVKRYSSGMVVRLGFAVAAHLEPEIMLVDEVLAVGDAAFQRRCLGKMNEISRKGRTVLFVSHSMDAIQSLCTRVLWLEDGRLMMDGEPHSVVREYVKSSLSAVGAPNWLPMEKRPGNGRVRVTDVTVLDQSGHHCRVASVGQSIQIRVGFISDAQAARNVSFRIWFRDASGQERVGFMTTMTGQDLEFVPEKGNIICVIPRLNVGPGEYILRVVVVLAQELGDEVDVATALEIIPGDYFGSGNSMTEYMDFVCDHAWSVASAED